MQHKLTLTIDEEIVAKAKRFAKDKGRSLSNLIEDYLKIMTAEETEKRFGEPISPIVASLQGSLKTSLENFDERELLEDELMKKYGLTT